jgi:hypothetical protein
LEKAQNTLGGMLGNASSNPAPALEGTQGSLALSAQAITK